MHPCLDSHIPFCFVSVGECGFTLHLTEEVAFGILCTHSPESISKNRETNGGKKYRINSGNMEALQKTDKEEKLGQLKILTTLDNNNKPETVKKPQLF